MVDDAVGRPRVGVFPGMRKVRAREDTMVGHAHPPEQTRKSAVAGEGQCHRKQTADGWRIRFGGCPAQARVKGCGKSAPPGG